MKYDYEFCYEEARKYTTLQDFRKYDISCYNACKRNNWFESFSWIEKE